MHVVVIYIHQLIAVILFGNTTRTFYSALRCATRKPGQECVVRSYVAHPGFARTHLIHFLSTNIFSLGGANGCRSQALRVASWLPPWLA